MSNVTVATIAVGETTSSPLNADWGSLVGIEVDAAPTAATFTIETYTHDDDAGEPVWNVVNLADGSGPYVITLIEGYTPLNLQITAGLGVIRLVGNIAQATDDLKIYASNRPL